MSSGDKEISGAEKRFFSLATSCFLMLYYSYYASQSAIIGA